MASSGTSHKASTMAERTPVLSFPRLHTIRAGTLSSEQSRVKAADKKVFTAGVKCRLAPPYLIWS